LPSPLAHGLAGVALYAALAPAGRPARDWRPWALAAFAAMAADLDFVPGLLVLDPSRYHHWATHSVLAAVVFVLLATPLASPLGAPGRRAAILGLAYASHLALDYVTVDLTVPRGIPLAWPVVREPYLAPFAVFADIHHGASWAKFVNWHNAAAVLAELVLVGLPVATFCALRLGLPGRPALAPSRQP
jgi:membrane-bound metal-dependent hydrolase YbcI (DUF457 family)